MMEPRKNKALYVHIPFCSHICAYCDFPKVFYQDTLADAYLSSLKKEILSYGERKYETIYIGGGTPSALNTKQLEDLLSFLLPFLEKNGEFTVECNIENVDEEKFILFQKYGVNRLSFGVQSFHEKLLKTMHRHHDKKDVEHVLFLAKKHCFLNLNVDLIYGFENESLEDVKEDIENFLSLNVPHISTYALTVHPHTMFGISHYQEMEEDTSREMFELISNTLKKAGYEHYEVSNFAREGFRSKHNQVYWRNDYYVGVGMGAEGYVDGIRYRNTQSITDYIKGITRVEEEKVALLDDMLYEIMLRLRTQDGIDIATFQKRYGKKNYEKFLITIERFLKNGSLIQSENSIACTKESIYILDYILREIFYRLEE